MLFARFGAQRRFAAGLSALHVAAPEKVITAGAIPFVANAVNAVAVVGYAAAGIWGALLASAVAFAPPSPSRAFRHKVGSNIFDSAHHTREAVVHRRDMPVVAGIGFATTLLELVATSIGFGVVAVGFVTSCAGMILGRTRKEVEAEALRRVFWGGVAGMCCLCFDLIMRLSG